MEINEIAADQMNVYARVSIAFEVQFVLEVESIDMGWGTGSGGLRLVETPVENPYWKDYDTDEDDGPRVWASKFNLSKWGILLASEGDQPVGGAVIAYDTPEVHLLDQRRDKVVLWDLRVQPEWRRKGIGQRLFDHAVSWAQQRNCRVMKIETQNVNVPACRFYAAQECELGMIHKYAYAGHPQVGDETMLLWYLAL